MRRQEKELRLCGAPSDRAALAWSWVEERLAGAGTYWVIAHTDRGHPHPRPVWGIWSQQRLHLSMGSPALRRGIGADPAVTVHLDSGTDVVIVEGTVTPAAVTTPELVQEYRQKYDWEYDVSQYGDLAQVVPSKVMAWQASGWAGRDSFQTTGCWVFSSD